MTPLRENVIQKMKREALRGVAPYKHDNALEMKLLEAYKSGDEEAGIKLAKLYNDVFSAIMSKPTKVPRIKTNATQKLSVDITSQDYEDLYQEILFQFFSMLELYDPKEKPLSHYIRSTLHLRVFRYFFSEFLLTNQKEFPTDEFVREESIDEDIFLSDENAGDLPSDYLDLYNALNRLSKKQRLVIETTVMKGWSSLEASRELGISHDAVRKAKQRALQQLREHFEEVS